MELIILCYSLTVSILLVTFLILLCLKKNCEESQYAEAKLTSIKHTNQKNGGVSGAPSPDEKEGTVISNGNAVEYEKSANKYEELDIVKSQVVELEARLRNGACGEAHSTQTSTNPPDVSPEAVSYRSSRNSTHSRVPSQERALPEIPGQAAANRHSGTGERPLPILTDEDDPSSLYDRLEHDKPVSQIKPKTEKSSQRSNKLKDDVLMTIESSESLIQPDEITRNSIVFHPTATYTECEARPLLNISEIANNSSQNRGTSAKTHANYTKVNKPSAASVTSPSSNGNSVNNFDALYMEPPPVPEKHYDVNSEIEDGSCNADAELLQESANSSAQDSGSGYYAVADDGPSPSLLTSSHETLPVSYVVLTAREPIDAVRARQKAHEDYETVDEARESTQQVKIGSSASDLYSEIQESQMTGASGVAHGRPQQANASGDELYAEIDNPGWRQRNPVTNARAAGNLNSTKGEQTDSAGYAIVQEIIAQNPVTPNKNDDEEDYAICNPDAQITQQLGLLQTSTRSTDDDDYATIQRQSETGQNAAQASATSGPSSASGSSAVSGSSTNSANGSIRGTHAGLSSQRFSLKKREHLYQEIDDVRSQRRPPDKSN